MNLTKKLKEWAVKNAGVSDSASDDVFKTAVTGALMAGKLSAKELAELCATDADVQANESMSIFKQIGKTLDDMKGLLTTPPTQQTQTAATDVTNTDKSAKTPVTKSAPTALEKMVLSASPSMHAEYASQGEEKSFSVRVKEAAEQYSTTKSAAVFPGMTEKGRVHPHAGKAVTDWRNRQIDNPSDLDKAIAGAYAKFLVQTARVGTKSVAFATMPQHDRELLLYAMENSLWGGTTDSTKSHGGDEDIRHRKLTFSEQKALIDDATSGGLEAAPIAFDDMAILTPLLNGELYPLVNVVPIDRGRRIEGVQISNVTGGWGGVDDTAVSLFNTTAFVAAFDTTIHRWEGAIVIGLDFMSDSPIEFANLITGQYGERLLEDLDDVIAAGNGTTQPEGVSVKSGTTSVSFGGSAATLSAYESLRFGVAKAEHKSAANSAVFCGTETSYQRAKAIPVGASDARRLSDTGGMPNYDDYSWMNRPFKINESLSNATIFYAIMNKYRMYRRRGLAMKTTQEGSTLVRANELLLVAMARYGGQLERGAVAAITTNAQA